MSRVRDELSVSASIDAECAGWLDIVERDKRRQGFKAGDARRSVAREIGCAPGTLENVARRRLKGVRGWVQEAIRAQVCRVMEREIQRLEAELQMARQCGARPDANEVIAAQAAIGEARRLIEG